MSVHEGARSVADVRVGCKDKNGDTIDKVFARKEPDFAVYRAGHVSESEEGIAGHLEKRVMIHFADDCVLGAKQRRGVAPLMPIRDEIEGLVGGWRSRNDRGFFGLSDHRRLRAKADCQDRRVGGALVQALEEDLEGARTVLEKIKADVLNERIAAARFEYLLTAFVAALAMMFLAWLMASLLPLSGQPDALKDRMANIALIALALAAIGCVSIAAADRISAPSRALILFLLVAIPIGATLIWPGSSFDRVEADYGHGVSMWRAAVAGAIGAFFSISLAIRGRTILPDLLRTANMMDAVLRVTIGFIAGAVLMGLISARVVQIGFGETTVGDANPLFPLIVGFVAGFAERLVPDLLDKASDKPVEDKAAKAAASANATIRDDPSEQSDSNAPAQQSAEPPIEDAALNDNDGSEIGEEGFQLGDDEMTHDEELPASIGGVARS